MKDEKLISYKYEGWFTISFPQNWTIEDEDDLLNVYSTNNPKGVLQISLYKKKNTEEQDDFIALQHLDDFINQFDVSIDKNSYMTLQTDKFIIATTNGVMENRFIKIWVIVEESRMLLATYISKKKTRELNIVDDIIYGIEFDNKV